MSKDEIQGWNLLARDNEIVDHYFDREQSIDRMQSKPDATDSAREQDHKCHRRGEFARREFLSIWQEMDLYRQFSKVKSICSRKEQDKFDALPLFQVGAVGQNYSLDDNWVSNVTIFHDFASNYWSHAEVLSIEFCWVWVTMILTSTL